MKRKLIVIAAIVLSVALLLGMTVPAQAAKPNPEFNVTIISLGQDGDHYVFEAEFDFNDIGAWGWYALWTVEGKSGSYKSGYQFDSRTTSSVGDIMIQTSIPVSQWGDIVGKEVQVVVRLTKHNSMPIGKDYTVTSDWQFYPYD